MKVVIDTNSLLSLVRYYLPFDKKGVLFNFFKTKIEKGEIIIIDKVFQECTYNSKGIVITTLNYLSDKTFLKSSKVPVKTDSLLAPSPAKFLRQVENQFVNTVVRRQKKLSDTEFENQKNSFLNDADMKQIILCLNLIKDGERVVLVTEETESSNDNKLFKKIPAICKELQIETMTLPELIAKYDGIDIDFQ
ncbi:MAG: DUF4411 family protein [Flavobacteriia bacterium]|nr:DUF4411 family protein [Flavobacteriia bacterium]OIP48435.1 MAG: hypothetical protein AUK46_01455 [Flavobacteriaceae bacterium CG2_30_31_66]PIV50301.1 MAG: DUF4411 domain-containing protein [Flavobacteriaceae bacterium CG02_land_8_20_14_3_00_34_13]PIV96741.1 MAG: DUF4411 domain-containing protein [Flavobacteriaceae bacterium CG17_big_fil_post_rev_8_21_14_2_50_31_13]PIX13487.1 MAG: DUF4411 domain-containing protein [Flavobacteriaceae bacterium CG_4_8_14_3_um_filter_31_8]PIY14320.1 MAG: DUF44